MKQGQPKLIDQAELVHWKWLTKMCKRKTLTPKERAEYEEEATQMFMKMWGIPKWN